LRGLRVRGDDAVAVNVGLVSRAVDHTVSHAAGIIRVVGRGVVFRTVGIVA
jgi:hypothetical protein